jgi:DNA modification methylase
MKFEDMINTIQLGDCYELIKNIPDNSIDLIIIDPPYEYTTGGGVGCFGVKHRNYHEEYYKVETNRNEIIKKYLDKGFDYKKANVWADKEISRLDIKHISSGFNLDLLNELDKKMRHIYIYIWCSKWQVEPLLKHYIDKDCNFDILTWHKTNPTPTMNNTYANDTEYLIMAREKGNTKLYGDYNSKKKYWITPTNVDDKNLYKHPTIKPLNIIKTLIENSTQPNDIVLDCFCGSGTTCVAAKETGRRYIGMEIDPEYQKIAVNRLNGITADGQLSIFTDISLLGEQNGN